MNNTRNLLLVAIIAATLVMGTGVIPMQSYADRGDSGDNKKGDDFKSKTSATMNRTKRAQANTRTRTTSATGAMTVSKQMRDNR